MKSIRATPVSLSEEQEQFFIETWNENRSYEALVILHDALGLSTDTSYSIAKRLREEGKIRDKTQNRYSEKKALEFKRDYENGKTLSEIAKAHNVGLKGVTKYLKELYGGKIPVIQGNLEGEEWKDIDGFSRYQVSNMGRIYSKTIHRMVYGYNKNNYRCVSLLDDSDKYHKCAIHKLVAQLFVPNPDDKSQVDHIDSNPQNNKATNLRWVNEEEQIKNTETRKKMQLAQKRMQKLWKIKPIIKKLLEIEPDKLQLVKMIIDYNA